MEFSKLKQVVSKKFLFIIILLIVLFSIYIFSNYDISKISLGMFIDQSRMKKEFDIVLATQNSIMNNEKILFDIVKSNTCYWIKSTSNKTHYILEINKYEYLQDMKGCLGSPEDTKSLTFDRPISLRGINCLCDGNTYIFEGENNGLKISKIASE